ncbi:MAG: hypothetical protein U1E05_27225, partial [Patescibacteria group bacterium]|nr:hypothetical protein [Patescibacteria group bacterium]
IRPLDSSGRGIRASLLMSRQRLRARVCRYRSGRKARPQCGRGGRRRVAWERICSNWFDGTW